MKTKKAKKTIKRDADDLKSFPKEFNERAPQYLKAWIKKDASGSAK